MEGGEEKAQEGRIQTVCHTCHQDSRGLVWWHLGPGEERSRRSGDEQAVAGKPAGEGLDHGHGEDARV